MLINVRVKKILYRSGYADELSLDMLSEASIPLEQLV
jgi:deoxycytidylate deaminase